MHHDGGINSVSKFWQERHEDDDNDVDDDDDGGGGGGARRLFNHSPLPSHYSSSLFAITLCSPLRHVKSVKRSCDKRLIISQCLLLFSPPFFYVQLSASRILCTLQDVFFLFTGEDDNYRLA